MKERTISPTVTFLEMREHTRFAPNAPLLDRQVVLLRVLNIPIPFYRYLFEVVGRDYLWVSRFKMSDEELSRVIHDERNEIFVVYIDGAPGGYFELDVRDPQDIEISFIGLTRENLGRGLGGFLLSSAIDRAWSKSPKRLHLQTCTLDHQHALTLYQKYGFVAYDQKKTSYSVPADWHPLAQDLT